VQHLPQRPPPEVADIAEGNLSLVDRTATERANARERSDAPKDDGDAEPTDDSAIP
jgi:hypothetical protein